MSRPYEWWADPERYSGDVAIDIGAHRGFWTRLLTKSFKTVHAFEPQPGPAAEILTAIDNGLDNIELHVLAVSNHQGQRMLYRYRDNMLANASSKHGSEGKARGHFWTSYVRLDDLFFPASRSVDFVKIDTEGYEHDVLLSGEYLLSRHTPALLIETHSIEYRQQCEKWLESHNYRWNVLRNPDLAEDSEGWKCQAWLACWHPRRHPQLASQAMLPLPPQAG